MRKCFPGDMGKSDTSYDWLTITPRYQTASIVGWRLILRRRFQCEDTGMFGIDAGSLSCHLTPNKHRTACQKVNRTFVCGYGCVDPGIPFPTCCSLVPSPKSRFPALIDSSKLSHHRCAIRTRNRSGHRQALLLLRFGGRCR